MDYQKEYRNMVQAKENILKRVAEICRVIEHYSPSDEQEQKYLILSCFENPNEHEGGWETEISENPTGIEVYYSRQVPYEDYEDTVEVVLSWEELQYSDEEAFDMWLRRGKEEYDKQKQEHLEDIERAAEELGYVLQEKK